MADFDWGVRPYQAFQAPSQFESSPRLEALSAALNRATLEGSARDCLEAIEGIQRIKEIRDIKVGSVILRIDFPNEGLTGVMDYLPRVEVYRVSRKSFDGKELGLREYWPVTEDVGGRERPGTLIEVMFRQRGDVLNPAAQRVRSLSKEGGRGTVDFTGEWLFQNFYTAQGLKPNARNIAEFFNL
ncbi:hypothetical protein HYU13_06395 [Candidatus Woesearchaeota archaeon]|nr:hypothetical protein [Candidatus Woesearchaeota archaeon]